MIISPNDDENYKEALREILIRLRAKRNTDKEGKTITSSARKQLLDFYMQAFYRLPLYIDKAEPRNCNFHTLLNRDGHPYRANDVFLLFAEKIHQFLSNNEVIDTYLEAKDNYTSDYHMLSVDGKLYTYLLIIY